MIKSCIELSIEIEMYLPSDDSLTEIIITSQDWAKLKAVANILKPLYDATNYLSKSKYTTLGSTLPIYGSLIKVSLIKSKIFITTHNFIQIVPDREQLLRSKELHIFCHFRKRFERRLMNILMMLLKRAFILMLLFWTLGSSWNH